MSRQERISRDYESNEKCVNKKFKNVCFDFFSNPTLVSRPIFFSDKVITFLVISYTMTSIRLILVMVELNYSSHNRIAVI